MSDFSGYYGRMNAKGSSHQESMSNSTKRQAYNFIMKSSTRSSVEYVELVEQLDKTFVLGNPEMKHSIVTDKESFYKRTVLFCPDEGVKLGAYLKYDGKTYLATGISDIKEYPQAFVDFCNYELEVKGEEAKIQVGKDSLGKPQWKVTTPKFNVPAVVTSKIYSVLDNSQIPLPEGAIMMYIPYHEKINVPTNYEFQIHGDTYQVTTVNRVNVLTDEFGGKYGYLEMRGQKDVNKS